MILCRNLLLNLITDGTMRTDYENKVRRKKFFAN